jgi:putative molybdenum carrier protein
MTLARIVSGGQTGVDRGALDAALDARFPCGGWCPRGRAAEDGVISERYPLSEMAEGGYLERTIRNVADSDATLVLYFSELHGGTEQTVVHCIRRQKPYKLVDAAEIAPLRASELAADFIAAHDVRALNVAGPRASHAPLAYTYAYDTVAHLLRGVERE